MNAVFLFLILNITQNKDKISVLIKLVYNKCYFMAIYK